MRKPLTYCYTFRNSKDGCTFYIRAPDKATAIVKAQTQYDQKQADARRTKEIKNA